jgi:antitoxin ChpS
MTYLTLDLNVQKATRAFKEKLGTHFADSRSILFGSRSKNQAHPESDADVAVLLPGSPGKFIDTKFFMDDLAYEVLLATGIRIQPLPIWQSEWERPEIYSNPQLILNIKAEGIPL